MPSGLAAGLSPAEFADLIAYLETLRSTGPITLPQGFTWARVATGITGATAMVVASDGRVFVCEQTGALRIVKGGRLLDAPFVTVRVDSTWERGLIGVALDPEFARNNFVYVTYVVPKPYPHHRVSRFTARGDVAVAGQREYPSRRRRPDEARRRGARRASGWGDPLRQGRKTVRCARRADGRGTFPGDGLAAGQVAPDQRRRLDSRGQPVLRKARGKYRAIWALGLRNPFTFAVQPETGPDLHQRRGPNRLGRDRRGFRRRELRLAGERGADNRPAVPRADPPLSGCLDRRRRLLPGRCVPAASRRSSAASTSSPISSRDGSRSSTRSTRKRSRHSRRGWPGRSICSSRPDGSLYVLQRDAWVIDGNFRPGTGSLLKIRTKGGHELLNP